MRRENALCTLATVYVVSSWTFYKMPLVESGLKSWASAGNYYGLVERNVAVESLAVLAGELRHAKGELLMQLSPSEHGAVETFFSRTVEAAGEAANRH